VWPQFAATSTLAEADVKLAEAPELPSGICKIQHPHFVDAQADLAHQPGRHVVPRRWCELPAGHQIIAPPGEQLLHLALLGRDPHAHSRLMPRGVHLIQRTLGHAAGQPVQLGLHA